MSKFTIYKNNAFKTFSESKNELNNIISFGNFKNGNSVNNSLTLNNLNTVESNNLLGKNETSNEFNKTICESGNVEITPIPISGITLTSPFIYNHQYQQVNNMVYGYIHLSNINVDSNESFISFDIPLPVPTNVSGSEFFIYFNALCVGIGVGIARNNITDSLRIVYIPSESSNSRITVLYNYSVTN